MHTINEDQAMLEDDVEQWTDEEKQAQAIQKAMSDMCEVKREC